MTRWKQYRWMVAVAIGLLGGFGPEWVLAAHPPVCRGDRPD